VRGFGVMRGYLDDPAATAAAIDAHGWLHTGDIGVLDDEGYVCITDRKSDMFISGGFNCYPAEIENLLARHPAIERVAVVGLPDARLGEVGWAYVVPRAGSAVRPDDIIDWARSEMANYKVPRQIVLVTDLPVNASGKVLRRELKERAKDFPS
jgi:acyl-CoA synthetase (AMP-forming)/AMP-acid ligase II